MQDHERLDIARDAVALIEAAHADDWEGARAIVANCRLDAVVTFLSRLAADVIESACDDADEAIASLRERHAGGPPGPGREWLQDLTELAGAASEGLAAQRRRWLATDQPWPLA
jgi:hypothetical protein